MQTFHKTRGTFDYWKMVADKQFESLDKETRAQWEELRH
ncbi:MAG: hypothetical protein QG629_426 [Patescibacteria group bacterium]|nr:hypothetical protein [Patescibacteria group bacterium]